TYQCSNTDNYRKADGTGWIPVNFTSLTTTPNPLTLLPVDPTNSTSTNLYYTYVSGSWELTALFETTGYQTKYAASDNGTSTVLFEVGNHLKITPNAVASRSGPITPTASVLTTSAATNVASSTATLNGSITAEGGASSTITGFDYGLTTSYGSEATSTYSGGAGSFSNAISSLSALTTYHFRAKSYSSAGWGYGSDQSFTALSAYDSYTKLMLHMDGTNGSTDFPDVSQSQHTVTAHGSGQVSTSQKKLGTGSVSIPNALTDYLSMSADTDWDFGNGNFTIDFWVRMSSPIQTGEFFVAQGNAWDYPGFEIYMNTDQGVTKALFFKAGSASAVDAQYYSGSLTWTVDQWYHIAVVRSGSTIYMFRDGVSLNPTAFVAIGTKTLSHQTAELRVGRSNNNDTFLNGYIDELRISKGIARWTSNFTPPTAPY
ncbi:MAG: LamG domain-containing protein, partial [Candidatus Paceibacterota bacterium]